ncbi:type VII toxin-antitoxin system MntA family adenylyltransferase antitoxin [Anaerosalibacter bizertensis]|uniref:Nucleotidyltransferase domain-containing protein n=1 Tax=Anaerosalibacter bizertensis TaxID=932217 RepID=A0A9Q4AED8_9FIRM|nr:nucleotidyltransferase domain-containing protein [Anaerosalibacter bizertensis]MBU5294764.1 nucleotidyltransferase domain-containing protein [Anaerosalibacter bizertensis]MCB5559792.1 nucleotidyltransferase domain-containing protein [Anaerosalibacter bizertensis]MCG4566126.1 nucleotidyltransferase domain-containing protein [Anaerosalibacter bizertensis]HHV25751.1 nucleotidyltransferase domain-containing protein [Tissierellia bacterium]
MDDLLRESINIFLEQAEEMCNINFAYIFGSYARGEENINSDIDIAIMPKEINMDKMSGLFVRGNLIELGKSIFKKDVDIVFLNADSVFLKYKIIQEGIVIKDSRDRITFESIVLREYFDFKYYSNYYNERMLV